MTNNINIKQDEDYKYDEKTKAVHLTEQGADKAERMFKVENLYDVQNVDVISHINTALRPSFASIAWCKPSEKRRPGIVRPVN
jgi:preprotein translocase subunit SecA